MLWKKNNQTSDSIQPWKILRWWRSAQEYLPAQSVDLNKPFQEHYDSLRTVLIEFDHEWSVISQRIELKQATEILLKRAYEALTDKLPEFKKSNPQLLLKAITSVEKKYHLIPYFTIPRSARAFFIPPQEKELPITMNLHFVDEDVAWKFITERKNEWFDRFEHSALDAFVQTHTKKMFRRLLKKYDGTTYFDELRDILTYIDDIVLDQSEISESYLKKVWGVPKYIFTDTPEQAAMIRLLHQKSYQEHRAELVGIFSSNYFTKLLEWELFHPFSDEELSLLSDTQEGMAESLHRLYKKLLTKAGISAELVELYGPSTYVERIRGIFSNFPTEKTVLDELVNNNLYTLLLEETVRFGMHRSTELKNSPEEVLHWMVQVLLKRVKEFEERKKVSS